MSVGKHISLEEVRHNPRLLGRFIKERIAGGLGEAEKDRFEKLLNSMCQPIKTPPEADQTLAKARGEGYSEIQTRKGTSANISGKRERASRE